MEFREISQRLPQEDKTDNLVTALRDLMKHRERWMGMGRPQQHHPRIELTVKTQGKIY
jgi:hypothetical protein